MNHNRLLSLVLLGFLAASGSAPLAAQIASHRRDTEALEPFTNETTFLLMRMQASEIELPQQIDLAESLPAEFKAAAANYLPLLQKGLRTLQASAGDLPVYATVGVPISKKRVSVNLYRKPSSDNEDAQLTKAVKETWNVDVSQRNGYLVMSPPHTDDSAIAPASQTIRQSIASASQAVAEYPAYLLLIPPEHVWRTVEELSPELPPQIGGGPASVLTDGVRWTAIGVEPRSLQVEVIVQSADQQAAQKFADRLPAMVLALHQSGSFGQMIPAGWAEYLIGLVKPQVEGSRVLVRVKLSK